MPVEMDLYRHGKTEGNSRGAYEGSEDNPLSAPGRRELELAGRPPAVEAVFSSPKRRCLETAAILYPTHTPTVVEDLRERHFGEFEGRTHSEIIRLPGYGDWGRTPGSMVFPGGESMAAFVRRCTAAFGDVMAICGRKGIARAAIIAHGGVIGAVLSTWADPAGDFYDWPCGCGQRYHLVWDGSGLTVEGRPGR